MIPVRLVPFLLAVPASAQIELREFATFDLSQTANPASPHFLGTHPSTISAASGSTWFVAGRNDGGATGVGVVRIDVDWQLGTTTFQPTILFVAGTPAGFGYTGLDTGWLTLLAAYDAGAAHPSGLQAVSIYGGNVQWSFHERGSSGVAFQSYWDGSSSVPAVASLRIGSDRRALHRLTDGAAIWTHADGMIVNPGGSSSWRDVVVHESTGNLYARRGNDVVQVAWAPVPNTGVPSVLVDLPDADAIPGQNVEFFTPHNNPVVVFNDRTSSAPNQSFFDVVRLARGSGEPLVVDWGTFSPPTGDGSYDFAALPDQPMLLILDSANRRVTLFDVLWQPLATPMCFGDGTGTACPCSNHGAPGNGCASSIQPAGANLTWSGVPSRSADTLVLHGTGMPDAQALYFVGWNAIDSGAGATFGDGLRCAGGITTRVKSVTNVGGSSQVPLTGDPPLHLATSTYPGNARYYQAWYRNAASFCTSATFNLTNAVAVSWGP